jgi:hypothetical protein
MPEPAPAGRRHRQCRGGGEAPPCLLEFPTDAMCEVIIWPTADPRWREALARASGRPSEDRIPSEQVPTACNPSRPVGFATSPENSRKLLILNTQRNSIFRPAAGVSGGMA